MSIAFICPIYDIKNHFEYGKNLAVSKLKFNITEDFYFVFSTDEQKIKFFKLYGDAFDRSIKAIIVPMEYLKYKSKVVAKKLYSLRYLQKQNLYDYLVLVDCETVFLRNGDVKKACEDIWNSRSTFISNWSPDGFYIQRTCYKTMGIYDDKRLKKTMHHYLCNYWFNEIQVYKCSSLRNFFLWLQSFDIDAIYNEVFCFEYYVFGAYLILEEGWKPKVMPLSSMGGINEYLYTYPKKKQKKILRMLKTHWTSCMDVQTEDTLMAFHLDRQDTNDQYSINDRKNRIKTYYRCLKDILRKR